MSARVRGELLLLSAAAVAIMLLSGLDALAADVPVDARPSAAGAASRAVQFARAPTAPITTTTVPTAPAPADPVDSAIHRWFGDVEGRARDIAWCESRFDAHAVSSGGGNHGLFQINAMHRAEFEGLTGMPFDVAIYNPNLNAQFARRLYDRRGWQPWACA